MDKITITRGLAELKLLDKRILKETTELRFVDIYQKRKERTLISGMTLNEFESTQKAKYQSVLDLIKRRNEIKSKILVSNSVTKVVISGVEYSVVEAIEKKNSIEHERQLLAQMKSNRMNCKSRIEDQRVKLDSEVMAMLQQNLGTDQAANKDQFEIIAKPFLEQNEFNMIDPLNIDNKINSLDKEIDAFISEVDFVLSESNSRTTIEV